MTLGTIDYASSYFKWKTPIPIHKVPTCKVLKQLKVELKVNASLVKTDLGSGNHRYLGLVLMD